MAEKDKLDIDSEQQQPKRSKLKLILLIMLVIFVSAGVALGVSYMLVFGKWNQPDPNAPPPPLIYVPLGPAMVGNITGPGRIRYVQVGVTVATRDPQIPELLERHMPVIRNNIIMLLSGKTYDDLITVEGKELARQEILRSIRATLQEREPLEPLEVTEGEVLEVTEGEVNNEDDDGYVEDTRMVESVYFTTFVMQ